MGIHISLPPSLCPSPCCTLSLSEIKKSIFFKESLSEDTTSSRNSQKQRQTGEGREGEMGKHLCQGPAQRWPESDTFEKEEKSKGQGQGRAVKRHSQGPCSRASGATEKALRV